MTIPTDPLPPEVLAAVQRGNKIEAIKLMRQLTGLGLKEAKDAVEASPQHAELGQGSPGEVRRSGSMGWVLLALVIAALVGYFLVRGRG
ncbi:ribosomal protein bL12 [Roseateles toxinivorans]|uniref:Ribosomal L7/L12-like protein n=1 Tax=Roseateles toxinivorans TaxID=270368 RepID=A0A4R6QUK1_9BURK|nr:50S ribosomal protein L7/L12 [Roseateles toxinivorans]TDP74275.1 ribosomal L7/L12-like protein [Roseateles toxinivorans]